MSDRETPVRSQVLDRADSAINGDRQQDYGEAQASFQRIASLWSAILDRKLGGNQITPQEVALMMAGLKISRAVGNAGHVDSYVDMAGYAALAAELGGVPSVP